MSPTPKEKAQKPAEIKRMTDYVKLGGGTQLEGERVELNDILGEDVVLQDFVFIPSSKFKTEGGEKKEFAVIQILFQGKLRTTSSGGQVIMDALKQMPKQYLPVTIKITYIKGKGGKKYYNIE